MPAKIVEIIFHGNASQLSAELRKMAFETELHAKSMSEKLAAVGKGALLGIGGAAIGIGAASVKMAGDFQAGLTTLVTGAGEAQKSIKMVGDGILGLAVSTGTSTKQLTDGLFMIESAGFHGAAGLAVLKAAAEGARVGNADLGVTANAVTTVMKDYHLNATQAADATNFLVAVVKQGKTHMEDLAGAVSQILPIASSLHVPLADIGGALATLTSHGIEATQAATYMRFALNSMVAPSKQAVGALKSVGLSSTDLSTTLTTKGLVAALTQLEEHLKTKFPQGGAAMIAVMSHALGGVRGMGAALGLTGQNLADFTKATWNTAAAIGGAHGKVIGFNLVQQDFNFKLDQAKEVIQTVGIKIGTFLIPILEKVAVALGDAVTWVEKNKAAFESAFSAIGAAVSDAWSIIGPIFNTILNVGLFPIRVALDLLHGDWTAVWNDIKGVASSVVDGIVGVFSGLINTLNDIISAATGVKDALSGIGNFIGFGQSSDFNTVFNAAKQHAAAGSAATTSHSHGVQRRAGGGDFRPGALLVGEHGPELLYAGTSGTVVPNSALGGGTQVIQLIVDGEKLHEVLLRRQDRIGNLGFRGAN